MTLNGNCINNEIYYQMTDKEKPQLRGLNLTVKLYLFTNY